MNERDLIQRWIEWKEKSDSRPFPQKKLAEDAGISPTYLSTILTGARNAGTRTIERIASAIGVTVSEFYAGPHEQTEAIDAFPDSPTHESPRIMFSTPSPPVRESIPVEPPVPPYALPQEETGLKFLGATPERIDRLFDTFGYSLGDVFSPQDITEPPLKPRIQAPAPVSDIPPHRQVDHTTVAARSDIPLLDRAPSGHWRDWIVDIRSGAANMVSVVPVDPERAFAVRVEDSSMAPKIDAGAVLVVNPEARFTSFDGGIGIAVRGGRFSVRHVYAVGDSFILVPSNPAYFPEVVPAEEVQVFRIAFSIPK